MKKKFYETPRTQHVEVETEGNFCGSVVDKGDSNSDVTSGNQTISGDYDFTENEWK